MTSTSIALISNRGGVGRTTLVYHLAHMISRLGLTVLAVDLDPQANLTSMCLDENEVEELRSRHAELIDQGVADAALSGTGRLPEARPDRTVADAVRPILEGTGDVTPAEPVSPRSGLWLLPGSLDLSRFEDTLANEWFNSFAGDIAAIRTATGFHRVIEYAAASVEADIVLIDVGPDLGAINRAALIAADSVLMPHAADLFSLKGLGNLGPVLREWRRNWQQVVLPQVPPGISAPPAEMTPLGYMIMRPETRLDRPVKAYEHWLSRKAADGALGSTQTYVRTCYRAFKELAESVLQRASDRHVGGGAAG
ncbi:ParA family protein [Streptomyces hebeiensis]